MINVAANVPATSGEFAELVSEHLDELVTYAAHLVGDANSAVELAAAGIFHAAKYPPARVARRRYCRPLSRGDPRLPHR